MEDIYFKKMKKTLSKIEDYLNKKSVFLGWIFIVLATEYLFLFSLEIILPGFVTEVFNVNLLLLAVVIFWLLLVLIIKKENQIFVLKKNIFNIILATILATITISLVFVLYKASYWEILIYLLFSFLSGKFLYDYLKQ